MPTKVYVKCSGHIRTVEDVAGSKRFCRIGLWPEMPPGKSRIAGIPPPELYDKAHWYADREPFQLPEDFNSLRFLVCKSIGLIDGNIEDERPFFAYLVFQAVQIPVQAAQAFIDPYIGTYVAH